MGEVFGLAISEGAIANILARAEKPLLAACVPIAAAVRESLVVGSDETTARVGAKTWWQWVLLSSTAICDVIADTRAAVMITAFLEGARQMCPAHLLRDTKYAIESGDTAFTPGFRLLLLRANAERPRGAQAVP
jgi:transposase